MNLNTLIKRLTAYRAAHPTAADKPVVLRYKYASSPLYVSELDDPDDYWDEETEDEKVVNSIDEDEYSVILQNDDFHTEDGEEIEV